MSTPSLRRPAPPRASRRAPSASPGAGEGAARGRQPAGRCSAGRIARPGRAHGAGRNPGPGKSGCTRDR